MNLLLLSLEWIRKRWWDLLIGAVSSTGENPAKYRHYGKGMVMNDLSLEEAFRLIQVVPDCSTGNASVRYVHRSVGGKDIYFLTNISDQAVDFTASFRINGMQPELWDAVTGSIRPLPVFRQHGETTELPLRLEVDGSAFVVFRSKGQFTEIGVDRPCQTSD